MRAAFLFALLLAASIHAQPGAAGNLSIKVVDVSGNPIPDSRVLQASISGSRIVIEGHSIFDSPPSHYKPRDAERSSFVGRVWCGRDTSIHVSAAGYRSVIKEDVAKTCPAEITVVLERTDPQPVYAKKLITLAGRLKDPGGLDLDGWLRIVQETIEYVPKINADGTFSAKLAAGIYQIKFDHFRCNQFLISNYRIGPEPKTFDINADCE
jgi:hypothetical protein